MDGSVNIHNIIKFMMIWSQALLNQHFGSEAMEKIFEKVFEKCEDILDILVFVFFNLLLLSIS